MVKRRSLLVMVILVLFIFGNSINIKANSNTNLAQEQQTNETILEAEDDQIQSNQQNIMEIQDAPEPEPLPEQKLDEKPVPTERPVFLDSPQKSIMNEAMTQSMSSNEPTISVRNVEKHSFIIDVKYPISGINGNGLAIRDKSTGQWRDIYGSFYATDGTYQVNGLNPATDYDIQMFWYTDSTNSWLRQEKYVYARTGDYIPSIEVTSKTTNSITINVVYPASGVYGNGLLYQEPSTGQWIDIFGSWYAVTGTYTITNLKPNTNYKFSQIWYRDFSSDWLRRSIDKIFVTSNQLQYFYDSNGHLDYVLSSDKKIDYEYDGNGNLKNKVVLSLP